ncbi:exocyst complex component 3-like protein isoform X2 [Anolis carolinensis]|uniref:exocyst complex component 3-like protein isoform X2 n=1 Tax=Anolis carolinensis TaxID=28377 RepID=UPI0002C88CA5|nr:PREDICTED: exocyst complex component 3-like protein isoform X2 [Anolis carolinensis]|eukprot:XP_008115870.1 PREDICTED: exocyst complex component 3-like protein isoform X2 [Anolis carolinensis]
MGMSVKEEEDPASPKDGEWPEAAKAEQLARGAALKWASGVFCRAGKLEGLAQYWVRETQRNSSIQSRIKSTLQSYLDGVSMGLEQLRSAITDLQRVQKELGSIQQDLASNAISFQNLQRIQEVMVEHAQLGSVVQRLPKLFSVPQLFSESLDLLRSDHLLEAHARLMELESLQSDILFQLRNRNLLSPEHLASVQSYFGGLLELNDALAQHLWHIVGHGTKLVSEDPALFVSALRIIEREEGIDAALLQRARPPDFLPPGRPKCWRQKFFQVIQDSIVAAHFKAVPGSIQDHHLTREYLASLQSSIRTELHIVKDLMVQCCPPHYNIFMTFATMYHQSLANHLHHLLTWDLDKQEIFALLHWTLHVYPSSEMMAHPDLLPEVDTSALGPLLPLDKIEYLEDTYLEKVQASISEWMQKTLALEFKEWFSKEEPESDYQGCFQTSLPNIIMKMLDENIQIASLISDTLREKMCNMTLGELETFLGSLYEDLVEFATEHQQEPKASKCYTQYLLSALNNCLALSASLSALYSGSSLEPPKVPPSLDLALEKVQKKACRLLLKEMLEELKPLFKQLPSHQWLSDESQLMSSICAVIEKHAKYFCRTREPTSTHLLSETEHLIRSQYLRALLQKRMVCQRMEERRQMASRMLQDASQFKELFCNLGLEEDKQTFKVIADLQELISLKDHSILILEVLGFVTKYPDVSDDHISMLLDLRGDISKEIHKNVLEVMAQNPQVLPENYEPIFSNILVPAPEPPFCLGKSKCA